jgi:nicotinic acid mononucleotide adenylyltransferase
MMDEPADDVSSTELRERLRAGRDISGMTPPAVEDYILRQRLYAGPPVEARG